MRNQYHGDFQLCMYQKINMQHNIILI